MHPFRKFSLTPAPLLGDILAPKDNSLNFLRLALAGLVLISHSYLYLYGSSESEPLELSTGRSLGEYAVQTFFILSGVMVAQSFHRSGHVVDFAAARCLRIFPALIVCVALTAFVLGPLMTSLSPAIYFTDAGLAAYVIKTLSLSTGMASLPGVFETNSMTGAVNTSLWTLKYEVICYIGLAAAGLLGLFEARWRAVVAFGLAAFITVVFYAPPTDAEAYTFIDSMRYFSVFFGTGVLAYLMRDKLALSAFVLAPLFALFLLTRHTAVAEIGSALFLAYLALWASTKTFGPMRAFSNRMDLSYGVYIYAGPIQQALVHLFPAIGPLALMAAAFMFAVPIAALSWIIVERPALRLRPRLVGWSARVVRRPRHAVR